MSKVERNNVDDMLMLTPAQAGMLFHCLREPERDAYIVQLRLGLRGALDRALFTRAWQAVVDAHEMLRVTFRWEESPHPVQIVLKHVTPAIAFLDVRDVESGDVESSDVESGDVEQGGVDRYVEDDRKRRLDLTGTPYRLSLIALGDDRHELLLTYHHILCDGWSTAILVDDFLMAYAALAAGETPSLPPRARVKDYLKWRLTQAMTNDGDYWTRTLDGVKPTPIAEAVDVADTPPTARISRPVPPEIAAATHRFGRERRLTLATIVDSVWAVLLSRYANTPDVVFGTTVAGRPADLPGIERTVGTFINTPPLRVAVDPRETFLDVARRVQRTLDERRDHENTAAVDIQRASGLDAGTELCHTVVVVENYPIGTRTRAGAATGAAATAASGPLSIESYSCVEATHYDLTLIVRAFDTLTIEALYRPDRLAADVVERLCDHLRTLLERCLRRPDVPLADIDMLTAAEKTLLVDTFNATDYELRHATIAELLDDAAATHADRTALIDPAGRHVTYRELRQRVDACAAHLRAAGVEPGTTVGVLVERSIAMMTAILGVLKAGSCYVPLSRELPAARIDAMLNDSDTRLLLASGPLPNDLRAAPTVVDLDTLPFAAIEPFAAPEASAKPSSDAATQASWEASSEAFDGPSPEVTSEVTPDDPAYILYTSGSTGTPKGVVVPHRAVVNVISWVARTYALAPGDVVLQTTPITFDVSVWELFSPLIAGATLCLPEQGAERDPAAIVAAAAAHGVTAFHLVPSMVPAFVEHVDTHGEGHRLSRLRMLFSSGEALPGPAVERVERVFGDASGRATPVVYVNQYGPTETTVWSTTYTCTAADGAVDRVPIGRPIDNTRCYVLDRAGQLVPIGVWGELYIGGAGVALGYLNRRELTAERFVHAPAAEGRRVYRTGDIVRWRADGILEFKGRVDRQVKIRGHRIELPEVEAQMLAVPGVTAAAVVVRDGHQGAELHAWFTAARPLDAADLADALAARLPSVMVPSRIVRVADMPRTSSGKLDVRALTDQGAEAAVLDAKTSGDRASSGTSRAPDASGASGASGASSEVGGTADGTADGQVAEVAAILADVLSMPAAQIGPDDSFFQLGGNSISAVRLTSALFRRFGVKVAIGAVFDHPTPRQLAALVRASRRSAPRTIPRVEAREYYELSYNQKRLWVVHELHPDTASYNLAGRVEFHHAVDPRDITAAANTLIQRHESLRTRFAAIAGVPAAIIAPNAAARVTVKDLSPLSPGEQATARQQFLMGESLLPFDLTRPPLLRLTLLKLADQHYELVVNVPHIVADGWSFEVLQDEFQRIFYANGNDNLPAPTLQYKDFAAWQHRLCRHEPSMREASDFWASILRDEPPELQLPYDAPPRSADRHRSAAYRLVVPTDLTQRLREWSRQQQIGLFLSQMAALHLTMAHVTGQERVLAGFVAAARQHESLEQVVGMFANTLVLASVVDKTQRVRDYCKTMQGQLLQALEHQSVPLELVCERLRMRFPRVQVFLNLLNMGRAHHSPVTDFAATHIPEIQESKFPLHYCVTEFSNGIEIICDYDADRFRPETIERKMAIYLHYLDRLASAGDQTIRTISRMGAPTRLLRHTATVA